MARLEGTLRAIKKLEEERADRQAFAEGRILGLIDNVRGLGATWKQVAEALGVPLQTAYGKYGDKGSVRAKIQGK
jgi:hypothetical protein